MLNYLKATVLLFLVLVTPTAALDLSKESSSKNVVVSSCDYYSEGAFFERIHKQGYAVYTLTDTGMEKLLKWANKARIEAELPAFEKETKFYFANVGVNSTGIVYIYKGCLIEGTDIIVPSVASAEAFRQAGILSEEIIPFIIKEGEDA